MCCTYCVHLCFMFISLRFTQVHATLGANMRGMKIFYQSLLFIIYVSWIKILIVCIKKKTLHISNIYSKLLIAILLIKYI